MLTGKELRLLPVLFAVSFLLSLTAYGQDHSGTNKDIPYYKPRIISDHYYNVEVQAGTSFYYGDLSSKVGPMGLNPFLPGQVIGLGIGSRRSRRIHLSAGAHWIRLWGDDFSSNPVNSHNYNRNLHFRNDLWGLSVKGRFDILPHRGHYIDRPTVAPYLFAGASAFLHSPYAKAPEEYDRIWVSLRQLQTEGFNYNKFAFSAPLGVGFEAKLNQRMGLALEIGLNLSSTDYLDDVSGYYRDPADFPGRDLGNKMANRSTELLAGLTNEERVVNDVYFEPFDKRGDTGTYDGFWTSTLKLTYILSKNKHSKNLSKIYDLHTIRDTDSHWYIRKNHYTKRSVELEEVTSQEERYQVTPLAVNTEHSEALPSFYKRGILFTSDQYSKNKEVHKKHREGYFNFFYSPKNDMFRNEITRPVLVDSTSLLGECHHEAVTAIPGKRQLIVAVCERDNPFDEMQMHKLLRVDATSEHHWSVDDELPFNTGDFSISHPSISEDGNTLYFVSDMKEGYGGTDIYVSYFHKGQWTYPKNLGPVINTEKDEIAPYVHEDGTLYFASDGHPGLGGLDIFEARPDMAGVYTQQPVNLGRPINSSEDDFSLILNSVKREGYFTSNRKGGKGGNDLYQLKVKKIPQSRVLTDTEAPLLAEKKLKLKGAVAIEGRDLLVRGVTVILTDSLYDDKRRTITDRTGHFEFEIQNDRIYYLHAVMMGFKRVKPVKISTVGVSSDEAVWQRLEIVHNSYNITLKGVVKGVAGPIQEASLTILNLNNDEKQKMTTDQDGNYEVNLKRGTKYTVLVEKKGHLQKKLDISTADKAVASTIQVDIELESSNLQN
ncbi:DUF6089 family protein [Algivirga pacifica]|uniref:DUF6089 domain-containing protein n=1 Tax=Algivirga pacifica TaxID=1162670 RepID=A0ABP9DG36_9BACT